MVWGVGSELEMNTMLKRWLFIIQLSYIYLFIH